MPTYEFSCPKGHGFERFYKTMSAAPSELPCPECGAIAARQLSGGAGLHFKGSGFYLTDYGRNAHRKPEPTKKAEGGKTEGGKAEGGNAEGGAAEGGKSSEGSAKTEGAKHNAESSKPQAESSKPKAQTPKPQSE